MWCIEQETRIQQKSQPASQTTELEYNWRIWGRPAQFAPPGDWRGFLIMAGRGFGKSRTGAEWIRDRVYQGARFIYLTGAIAADARDFMVERESGLLAIFRTKDGFMIPRNGAITFHTGAHASLFRSGGFRCEV